MSHYRFKEHHRIAILMALVTPVCAFIFYHELDWWNPWLWGCSGMGLALALCLHSVVMMIRKPDQPGMVSKSLVTRSQEWFPFFFVVMQSLIASLIVMFIWFSITTLVLKVPTYVHAVLVALALTIPIRRYFWAKITANTPDAYKKIDEILHGTWHILMSIFIARCIISLTVLDADDTTKPSLVWPIMVWTPAVIYILYTAIAMFYHLKHGEKISLRKEIQKKVITEEPVDRF